MCQSYQEDKCGRKERHLSGYLDTENQSKKCSENEVLLIENMPYSMSTTVQVLRAPDHVPWMRLASCSVLPALPVHVTSVSIFVLIFNV